MALAYVKTAMRGESDLLLAAFARQLAEKSVRLSGVVQSNTACEGSERCDMDVEVLPEGPVIRISQSLGTGSRGCRLDPSALEQAVGLVSPTLSFSPELLIINKFGKHEADGRGFRPVIAEALMENIPVLTAANDINESEFLAFSDGLAAKLDPSLVELQSWFDTVKTPAAVLA